MSLAGCELDVFLNEPRRREGREGREEKIESSQIINHHPTL